MQQLSIKPSRKSRDPGAGKIETTKTKLERNAKN